MFQLARQHLLTRHASYALAAHAVVTLGAVRGATAQTLPIPGGKYVVTAPFQVHALPNFRSRVLRVIRPGDTVVAVRVTRDGWTEVRRSRSKRAIGFGQVTRGAAPTNQPPYTQYAQPSPVWSPGPERGGYTSDQGHGSWGIIAAVAAACGAGLLLLRRRSPARSGIEAGSAGSPPPRQSWSVLHPDPVFHPLAAPPPAPLLSAPPTQLPPTPPAPSLDRPVAAPSTRPHSSAHEVLAIQCKWTEAKSHLGPNVVSQLYGDLEWYKEREAGAFRGARGVIVTSAALGSDAKRRAAGYGIDYVEHLVPPLPLWADELPFGYDRSKRLGDWYEEEVALWYEEQGYRVTRRGLTKRKKDGGIDLICVPR